MTYTWKNHDTFGMQHAYISKCMVHLWQLGYESFIIDRTVYISSRSMKDLISSRHETIPSILYMSETFAHMIQVSEARAKLFVEERGNFNEPLKEPKGSEDSKYKEGKSRSSIFISRDYLLQSQMAKMVEHQFYLNVSDATYSDYLRLAISLS